MAFAARSADKCRAVTALLHDPEWSSWSDREIARRCGVDHKTVSALRRELSGDNPQMAGQVRKVERSGTTYTLRASQAPRASRTPPPPRPAHIPPASGEEREGGRVAATVTADTGEADSMAPTLRKVEQLLSTTPNGLPTVRAGEWLCVGRHRLFCGSPDHAEFRAALPAVPLALLDTGPRAVSPRALGWLADRARVVATVVPPAGLSRSLQDTPAPYVGALAGYLVERDRHHRSRGGDWLAVLLFSRSGTPPTRQDVIPIGGEESTAPDGVPASLLLGVLELLTAPGEGVAASGGPAAKLLLLAEIAGRNCFAAIPDPSACALAAARWESLTGERARLRLPGRP